MALIPVNPPTPGSSPFLWRFTWSSGGTGPYRVYYQGRLAAVVDDAAFEIFEPEGLVPMIEVATDESDLPDQVTHPGQVLLQWLHPAAPGSPGSPEVAYYRIDQQVGGDWETIDTVPWRRGSYHLWASQQLEDDTLHTFRVVPVLPDGGELDPAEYSVRVVRLPDVPRVAVSYSSETGNVTVSAG